MNEGHAAVCSSAEWAEHITGTVLPAALGALDLGDEVLEVGPGYGASTTLLAATVPRLTAIEVDGALAVQLRQRFPAVTVVHGRGEDMPFADGRFTAAVCFTMLHHVHSAEAQDALFAEVRRVLAPGAVFAGSDSVASARLHEFHSDDIYVPVDPGTLPDRLRAAGFHDVRVAVAETGEWFTFSARV